MSTAEYQKEWRKRHGQTGPVGRPITHPCGTTAAYKRHRRHGEQPCPPCREAWNQSQRDYYRQRKGQQ